VSDMPKRAEVSDKVKSAAEHAKDVAAKHRAEVATAADKAEAYVKEHAAKANERRPGKAS
jgi:hypothetical protein